MSVPRRSSSPLSSATPSPLQAPLSADKALAPPTLDLRTSTPALTRDDDGNIMGGSSPTTLTEPLTESELTEDDDEIEDGPNVATATPGAPEHDLAADDSVEGEDDENEDERRSHVASRLSQDGSSLSPSPSLTPPPPSDPPRSDALPSSPHAHHEAGDAEERLKPDETRDDEVDGEDDTAAVEDEEVTDDRAPSPAEGVTGRPSENYRTADVEDEDGDVTMRAETHLLDEIDIDSTSNMGAMSKTFPEGTMDEADDADPPNVDADTVGEEQPDEAEEDDDEDVEDPDAIEAGVNAPSKASYHHSSHAPPPTPAAIRALFALEVKFAALRDRLYVERMEESAREEEMVLNGTHPALLQLNKTLGTRRERLHEVASRRYQEQLKDLGTWRNVEEKISWQTWTDQRDQLQWEEFEHTWSKRRRLAREKNELETPKVHRPVPRVDKAPRPFDWSAGAVPSKLSADDALRDLQLMEARRQQQQQQAQHHQQAHASRNASPMYSAYSGGASNPVYQYQATQHPAHYLISDPSYPDRRHNDAASSSSHHRPLPIAQSATQSATNQEAVQPRIGNAGTFAQQRRPSKVESYTVPPRRDVGTVTNGDRRSNGHVRPPQSMPSGASASASSTVALGGSNASPMGDPKAVGSTAGPSGSAQTDRPPLSARFPGFNDYLSGGGGTTHHSFQHSMGVSKGASGSSGGNPPVSSHSAALTRPAFSQAPQPQAAGAQRS